MPLSSRALVSESPADTSQIARQLAACLAPGDVVLVSGGIGAGKTHFARALIQSLQDPPEDVPSPTFTLVQVYETPKGDLWHTDLYRLSGPDQCDELGLVEAFETAICLVEWPDRLGDLSPPDALSLTLTPDRDSDDARNLRFDWSDPRWTNRISDLHT